MIGITSTVHSSEFWSRATFIALSAIVALSSAYGFFTEYDVWSGVTVASAAGVALAALCAVAQFCSLNLSHQARRRRGRDRALCLVLMVVCGGWSAYGLHHFWDISQTAAVAAGHSYRAGALDPGGNSLVMGVICVAIAFVEPMTFWVLGGSGPERTDRPTSTNVETIDPARRVSRPRAAAAAAMATLAVGAIAGQAAPEGVAVSPAPRASVATPQSVRLADVERVGDRLTRDGQRVSFRRLAAEMGVSKSRIERILAGSGVSISGRWPSHPAVSA